MWPCGTRTRGHDVAAPIFDMVPPDEDTVLGVMHHLIPGHTNRPADTVDAVTGIVLHPAFCHGEMHAIEMDAVFAIMRGHAVDDVMPTTEHMDARIAIAFSTYTRSFEPEVPFLSPNDVPVAPIQ